MNKKILGVVIGLVLLLTVVNTVIMAIPIKAAVNVQRNSLNENSIIVKSSNPDPTYELLIIAPEKFTSALQPLVVHKNDVAGISTILVTTSEIYAGDYFPVEGRDKPEKIKYFIKNAYDEWGIKYVLLVGIYIPRFQDLPVRYVHNQDVVGKPYDEPYYLSDLYYADLYDQYGNFSSWDTDGDGIFGEWYMHEPADDYDIDLYPDVYVGRLPCKYVNQVQATVNKIITYETNTYGKDWFKNIIGVSGDTYIDGTWYTADGTTSWSYDWDTTQQDDGRNITDGEHIIYARCYDGEEYSKVDAVTVYVNNAMIGDPVGSFEKSTQSYQGSDLTVQITYPGEGDTVSGTVTITGTASNPDGDVTLVEVAFDGGGWRFPTPGYEGEENVLRVFESMSNIGFNPTTLFVSDGSFSGPKDIRREVNKGAGFLYLDGHSCPASWSCKDEDGWINGIGLFDLSAYLFSNQEKLPVAIWGGCHTFEFDVGPWQIFNDPNFQMRVTWVWECLAWAVTRLPYGGAIAAIGTTGLGLTKEDRNDCWQEDPNVLPTGGCSDYMYPQFFYNYIDDGGSSSGSDILLGEMMGNTVSDYLDHFPIDWSQYATNDSADDAKTAQQTVLFGDPSLKIGGYDVEGDSSEFEVEAVVANVESIGVNGYTGNPVQSQGTGIFENIESVPNTPSEPASGPDTPFGPTSGELGVEYTFTALVTGSPSQDWVCYIFDWGGDETYSDPVGPQPQGQTAEAKYVWSSPGEYQVRVKAWLLDTENNVCEETDWSDSLVITIGDGTSNQQSSLQSTIPLFFQILERLASIR